MSKGKSVIADLLIAVMIGLLVYLPGQLLLALLVVKGYLPETQVTVAQLFLGMTGAFLGGLWAANRLPMGALPSAASAAAGMAAVTMLLGVLCYEELAPVGTVALRVSLMAAGALLAGLTDVAWSGRYRKRRPARGGKRKSRV